MSNISIRKMRVFLAALEHKSFTKASVAQNISQPAATIIVNHIEEEFQCELFQRQGTIRKALPTAAGEKVAETFSRIVANYDGELATLSAKSSGGRRQRRILIQTSYDLFIDKGWLRNLMNHYASDDLSIEIMPRQNIMEEVANRKATLGLIDGSVEHPQLDYAPLGAIELLVAIPEENTHLHKNSTEISWKDIGKEVLLFNNLNPALQRQVQAKIKSSGLEMPRVTSCESISAMVSLSKCGKQASIIPDAMKPIFEKWADCRYYRFSDVSFSGQFGLVTPWGSLNRLPGEITRVRSCFSETAHA